MATEVQRVLDKWGNLLVRRIKLKIEKGGKFYTGQLYNSITYKYSMQNGVYRIQITGAPHLIFVDRGRKQGAHKGKFIPIQPLINWIKRKKIQVNVPVAPKGQVRQTKEKAIRGMAFAISKSVQKRGFKNAVAPFPLLETGEVITRSPQFLVDLKMAIVKDLTAKIKLP